ncbi:hypothetical protein TI04_13745, partial [Achromatium sp. WMS2]
NEINDRIQINKLEYGTQLVVTYGVRKRLKRFYVWAEKEYFAKGYKFIIKKDSSKSERQI